MPSSPSSPDRVLVVEDEHELGRHLCAFLTSRGLTTRLVTSTAEAVTALAADPYLDLVITDLYLGRLESRPGGLAVAEAAAWREPPVPVILLTGRPSMENALEGLRQHAFDYLTKPVSLPQLFQRVRKAIDERRLRQRIAELEQVVALLSSILPNAIEAKDPSTRGHSDRVATYADTLGQRVDLDAETRRDLRLAAMLHDVGKIGVPEAVLLKPGALTSLERIEIEKHPDIGYRILEPLHHLPRVRDWVHQHHERWDGRGYPQGLAGQEVALPGRILILAEVFDALATARCYKEPWPNDRIADWFAADRGGHFDADLALLVAEGVRQQGVDWFAAPAFTPTDEERTVAQATSPVPRVSAG